MGAHAREPLLSAAMPISEALKNFSAPSTQSGALESSKSGPTATRIKGCSDQLREELLLKRAPGYGLVPNEGETSEEERQSSGVDGLKRPA